MERILSGKRIQRRRYLSDEKRGISRSNPPNSPRAGLLALHQQIGNKAIQRLLAQRQAGSKQAEAAKAPVEAGQIKIEKPQIEEYEVDGGSLAEVAAQVLSPEQWYEYTYQYQPKIEKGVVTKVDVTVQIKIHLPRWVGLGWTHAPDADKASWLAMVNRFSTGLQKWEEMGRLPVQFVGLDWATTPEAVKNAWRGMMQEMHNNEKKFLEITRRRVLVLQKRLLGQPGDQHKAIFTQFQQDLTVEEGAYNQQREFGREQKITLSVDNLVQ